MTTTLNEDRFEPGPAPTYGDPLVHDIVYGEDGWYDNLDRGTLNQLLAIRAITLVRQDTGPNHITNIYRTVEGKVPERKP